MDLGFFEFRVSCLLEGSYNKVENSIYYVGAMKRKPQFWNLPKDFMGSEALSAVGFVGVGWWSF